MSFAPFISLDLFKSSAPAFNGALDKFEDHRQANYEKLPPFSMANGWYTVTPEMAESMLMRNPINANRRPALATVQYYARQMLKGDWKRTGQPVIFTKSGKLVDAGHRLWACYLSGAPFDTYIVTDVDDGLDRLFAFIDNSKPRSPKDALATAGLNGLSPVLAAVVKIADAYEYGAYTATSAKHRDRMSPIEVIQYVESRPNIQKAARYMAGEHSSANEFIGHNDVAAFAAYQILDLYSEEVLDEFMYELDRDDHEEGSAIASLLKVIRQDKVARPNSRMKKHHILACIIKAFNAWVQGEQMTAKKIPLRTNEEYPSFLVPEPQREAAE